MKVYIVTEVNHEIMETSPVIGVFDSLIKAQGFVTTHIADVYNERYSYVPTWSQLEHIPDVWEWVTDDSVEYHITECYVE
jgi:hypothetical protein